ncbi:MAG: tetratricopeptide repeat protein [Oscillospiraceae bacterium]|jgi:tetratricopeptide (TPR) repeat protein|nr:tetratricopeptide repeat protein [Oscillospiraceae bacterium]
MEEFQKALADQEKQHGADHPAVADAHHSLADAFTADGLLGSALPHYEKALAIREKALGADHPDTAATRDALDDVRRAHAHDQRAFAIFGAGQGVIARYEFEHYYQKAQMALKKKDYLGALPWYEKAVAVCEKALGTEHALTLTLYYQVGEAYEAQGEIPDALDWYDKAHALRR